VLRPRFSSRAPARPGDGPDDLIAPTFRATRRLAEARVMAASDDPDDLLDPTPGLAGPATR
jgi:hypothetical protein